MPYQFLADSVVLLHLAFIVFAVLGGILAAWRRRIIWIHLPAVAWSAWIECSGGICPLTYLENWLLVKSGRGGYHGDFMSNYIIPLVYPPNLTREIQMAMAAVVIVVNLLIYGYVWGWRK
jgi:hypothetical protein